MFMEKSNNMLFHLITIAVMLYVDIIHDARRRVDQKNKWPKRSQKNVYNVGYNKKWSVSKI